MVVEERCPGCYTLVRRGENTDFNPDGTHEVCIVCRMPIRKVK